MSEDERRLRPHITGQVAHWRAATIALDDPENFASAAAWASLERYMGLALRGHLSQSVHQLKREANELRLELAGARSADEMEHVRRGLVRFRQRFLRTETVLDFFGDAINTRTSPRLAAVLAACDKIAVRSMSQILDQLGKETPPALTYVDKGLGASILRAGLRLWDGGSLNPVAAVKIVRHNLLRPTSLIHETGHQVAHLTGWTDELARGLERELGEDPAVAAAFSGWASEIAADVFAFVHTGYASVAALHDVVAGEEESVFRLLPGDPHPVAFLRVLLGVHLCRRSFGTGPWNHLAEAWTQAYPVERAPADVRDLLSRSVPLLSRVADVCLAAPVQGFGNQPVVALVDPSRVSPEGLARLEVEAGAALYRSPHWLDRECVRLLALTGLRMATAPERAAELAEQQEDWMLRLGGGVRAAVALLRGGPDDRKRQSRRIERYGRHPQVGSEGLDRRIWRAAARPASVREGACGGSELGGDGRGGLSSRSGHRRSADLSPEERSHRHSPRGRRGAAEAVRVTAQAPQRPGPDQAPI